MEHLTDQESHIRHRFILGILARTTLFWTITDTDFFTKCWLSSLVRKTLVPSISLLMSAISWPQSPNWKASTLDTREVAKMGITQREEKRVYFTLLQHCFSPFWCITATLSAGFWLASVATCLVLGAHRGPAVRCNILRGVMWWAVAAVGLFPAPAHLTRTPLGQHCGGQTWSCQSWITQRGGFKTWWFYYTNNYSPFALSEGRL